MKKLPSAGYDPRFEGLVCIVDTEGFGLSPDFSQIVDLNKCIDTVLAAEALGFKLVPADKA